jgi:hypothetical protein
LGIQQGCPAAIVVEGGAGGVESEREVSERPMSDASPFPSPFPSSARGDESPWGGQGNA